MKKTVYVVISCDADPDRPQFGGVPLNAREKHQWKGIENGIPKLKDAIRGIVDTFNNNVKMTWFLRSDTQMHDLYGDYSWPAHNFKELWKGLEDGGDEIGWHPHLWRWTDKHGTWFQELKDESWIRNCFLEGYKQLSNGFEIKTTRTGWDFQNNLTMNILNELSIVADLSALPGFKSERYVNRDLGLPHNCYDWMDAPNEAYHPSASNYKEKGNLTIIEIPHACFHQNYWIYAIRKGLWRSPLGRVMDKRPLKSYALMICLDSLYFYEGAKRFFKKSKPKSSIFVSYFHPDDLLEEGKEGFNTIIKNLGIINDISRELNIPYKFITATEAASIVKEHIGYGK